MIGVAKEYGMLPEEFLARVTSPQISELMAWFQLQNENIDYIQKDIDPQAAYDQLEKMELLEEEAEAGSPLLEELQSVT